MINLEKKVICDGVNFTCIHDSRFKTSKISATMFLPLDSKTASKNAILPFILSRSCKDYPNFIKLNEKLSELYGATINTSVNKLGDFQALTISITGIDDKYSLDNKSVSKELTKLLCSILFRPNLVNNKFNDDDFNQEKRQLIELIESEFNDKRIYSKLRCEQLMCSHEKYGINRYGTKKQVRDLNNTDIFKTWDNAIKTSQIEFIMIGNSNYNDALKIFEEEISKLDRSFNKECETEIIRTSKNINEYIDKMEVSQCKLVMGFRAGIAAPDDDVTNMRIMTALFGGTPHSKLFLNVREKMSLCYYCAARYDIIKGIILVECGVEKQNIDKAKNEILNQLKSIKNGEFDESEITSTKLSVENTFRSLSDSLASLESFYISQTFDSEISTPEQQAEKVNNVSKNDIIEAANKVTLDTVYILETK